MQYLGAVSKMTERSLFISKANLPGATQDEAGLTRKFETSHVGGATC